METGPAPAQSLPMILARGASVLSLFPGLLACAAVAVAAVAVQALELRLLGRGWIDSIVLAILIGAAVRSVWTPPAVLKPGVEFSARELWGAEAAPSDTLRLDLWDSYLEPAR